MGILCLIHETRATHRTVIQMRHAQQHAQNVLSCIHVHPCIHVFSCIHVLGTLVFIRVFIVCMHVFHTLMQFHFSGMHVFMRSCVPLLMYSCVFMCIHVFKISSCFHLFMCSCAHVFPCILMKCHLVSNSVMGCHFFHVISYV